MDMPTNIQKVGRNDVSYEHANRKYVKGLDYIMNRIEFYEYKMDKYEEGSDKYKFYSNYKDFYQYIKDTYDGL